MMRKTTLYALFILNSFFALAQTPATALNFDGINDYVNLINQTQTFNYDASSIFTIEFWIKPSDKITSQTIIGKGSRTAGKGFIIRVLNNQISIRNRDVIIGGPLTVISPTAWSHVAISYNATAVKIYINGVLKQSGTLTIIPINVATPHKMFIGARRADDGTSSSRQKHFKGTLDELRFWNVERSVSDIMNAKDCALAGDEPNLVSYFKFDQGFDNQNNSTQTTLINTTNTLYNGALNTFALSGVTSNFLTSSNVLNSCTLSINSIDLTEIIKLSPNPSTGKITLINTNRIKLKNLVVTDINGRIIKQINLNLIGDRDSFDFSDLHSGVYFVSIYTNNNSKTIKLILK